MADDDDSRTSLDRIATQIADSVGSVADEMLRLSETTSAIVRRSEQDRARMRQVMDHFAVGSIVADDVSGRGARGLGDVQINRQAMRRDLDALDESISRGHLLHGRLMASHRMLRDLRSSFWEDGGEEQVVPTGDVRLQQATLAAREDERGRLAREIHDGPAQVLANAIFALDIAEQVARRDPDRVPGELSQVRALLRDGVAEMRRFMTDLRPAMLTDRGLLPTLQRYVVEYNRFFDKQVTFTGTDVPPTLGSEQQLNLFRIVQEGLQNLHKHAGTRSGAVAIGPDPAAELLVLSIVDEGKGFDMGSLAVDARQGAGLTGIRERARLMGADLDLRSAPGVGTSIRVALPLAVRQAVGPADGSTNGRST
ncbi:MAG: hypothetical protein AVDCRST_MAG33-470 [uncultured Thermomicrobiales bacterium]|uniref:Histidine kinase domain-containing protein n=1 Tax=uncultured Thermomicrobiales bacterium TaxID=1645740 RepID=A0A6J4UBC5_9BACT|nr:MAG: hypothetical protein AVDCRST_MAG33-470 [uncultured Thermomicrobiales bacterium]